MKELTVDKYPIVLPLIHPIENKAVYALSVIDQTQQGRIFVNHEVAPTSVFITSNGGFYCLAGNEEDEPFVEDVVQFMNEDSNHNGFFALGVFTTAWEKKIDQYYINHSKKITRAYYSFNREKFMKSHGELKKNVQKDFEYLSLNETIAHEYREKFYPYYQRVWQSNQHFCEHGIGHFITKNDQIISVCTSPYVGGGYAEIDIITIEEFKRQGFANVLCARFIQECLTKNLTPNWCCHTDNVASNSLAQKCGFVKMGEHSMYWYHV